jgi:hypothetical protein
MHQTDHHVIDDLHGSHIAVVYRPASTLHLNLLGFDVPMLIQARTEPVVLGRPWPVRFFGVFVARAGTQLRLTSLDVYSPVKHCSSSLLTHLQSTEMLSSHSTPHFMRWISPIGVVDLVRLVMYVLERTLAGGAASRSYCMTPNGEDQP